MYPLLVSVAEVFAGEAPAAALTPLPPAVETEVFLVSAVVMAFNVSAGLGAVSTAGVRTA